MTFSRTDMLKKTWRFWKVRERPRAARRSGASPVTSAPASRTAPADGRSSR